MDIDTVIEQLEKAPRGSRVLDANIAYALGWKLLADVNVDPMTSDTRNRRMWLHPKSRKIAAVPLWTTSMDAASDLANEVAPNVKSGLSWEDGGGSAKVGDGPFVEAATSALAMCISALDYYKSKTTKGKT